MSALDIETTIPDFLDCTNPKYCYLSAACKILLIQEFVLLSVVDEKQVFFLLPRDFTKCREEFNGTWLVQHGKISWRRFSKILNFIVLFKYEKISC